MPQCTHVGVDTTPFLGGESKIKSACEIPDTGWQVPSHKVKVRPKRAAFPVTVLHNKVHGHFLHRE